MPVSPDDVRAWARRLAQPTLDGRGAATVAAIAAGAAIVPVLIAIVDGGPDAPSPTSRRGAAIALGRIGAPAVAAVDRLRALAADPDPVLRVEAMRALGGIGPAASAAVPALAIAAASLAPVELEEPLAAIEALGRIGGADAVDALVRAIDGVGARDDRYRRRVALDAIARVGARGDRAVVEAVARWCHDGVDALTRARAEAARAVLG